MKGLAPIVLFCYNRPEHTEKTLNALSENFCSNQSELFVFCDGPKSDATDEQNLKIKQVRKVIRSKKWCGKVFISESESNKGLANSIISGVNTIVNQYGKVIVLEDDLISSKYFLQYMNHALNKYEHEKNVMQISGHQFPIEKWSGQKQSFFLPFTTSWGWGTWKRAWDKFDSGAVDYEIIKQDNHLRKKFDLNDSYPYSSLLIQQKEGRLTDSWAILWWWSVFKNNGITLFPDSTLIENIGFGAEATHTTESIAFESNFNLNYSINSFPEKTIVNEELFSLVCKHLVQPRAIKLNEIKRNIFQNLLYFFFNK